MNKPPAFQFYADNFLEGTGDMTPEEVGVYIRLLCHQWSKGGLEPDDQRLQIMAGQCRASALAKAKTKFGIGEDGLLRNARLERERVKQAAYREKQAENGAKRWSGDAKPHAKPPAVALPSLMPNACFPSPSPVSINTNTGVLELQIQDQPKAKPFQPSETQKRLNKFFKRRDSTKWSKIEEAELKSLEPISTEDMVTVERYYTAKHPPTADYRRRDMITLLRNWNGELDRARQFKPSTCY